MIGMIIAILSGICMSVQGVFNTQMTRQTGPWMTNAFAQLTGFIVCAVLWFWKEREKLHPMDIFTVRPIYLLSSGILGVIITYTVILSMDQMGPAKAVMFIVCAQLLAATFIEAFGWFGMEKVQFDWRKIIGTLFFIVGIILYKWKG